MQVLSPDSDTASGGAGAYYPRREAGGGGQDTRAKLQEAAGPVREFCPTFAGAGEKCALCTGVSSPQRTDDPTPNRCSLDDATWTKRKRTSAWEASAPAGNGPEARKPKFQSCCHLLALGFGQVTSPHRASFPHLSNKGDALHQRLAKVPLPTGG